MEAVHVCVAGSCLGPEPLLTPKAGRWRYKSLPNLVAILQHRTEGVILVDTGYDRQWYDEVTRHFPAFLYRYVIPVQVRADQHLDAYLALLGQTPADVKHVIITHFHGTLFCLTWPADHICALRRFPNAQFIYSVEGYRHFREFGESFHGARHAFFPKLLPQNFEDRSRVLNGLDGLQAGMDLFGDGSVVVHALPGHCPGQIGVWLRRRSPSDRRVTDAHAKVSPSGSSGNAICSAQELPHRRPEQATLIEVDLDQRPIFFVGDACWDQRNLDGDGPHWLTFAVVHHDKKQYMQTMDQLIRWRDQGTAIVPSHCMDSIRSLPVVP